MMGSTAKAVLIALAWGCSFFPQVVRSSDARLLFFTAPWCEPCRKMEPLVANLARKYRVQMIVLDFGRSPQAVEDFGVERLPTMILINPKGQILLKTEDASKQSMDALAVALKKLRKEKARMN